MAMEQEIAGLQAQVEALKAEVQRLQQAHTGSGRNGAPPPETDTLLFFESALRLLDGGERFRLLFERAPLPYQSLDEDGCFLEVNQAWLNMLGYRREEVIGRSFGEFLHPDWIAHFKENFPKFKASGEVIGIEYEMVKRDGSAIQVIYNGKIGRDDRGRFQQTHCIIRDITENKLAEEALRESEARFRSLLENVPSLAVQGYRPDGTIQYWNQASELLYGYSADEAIGRNLVDLMIPPDMREWVQRAIQQMVETGEPIPASELSLMGKYGKSVAVFSSHAIVRIPGRPPELFSLDVDLSEQKRLEKARSESEEKFAVAFRLSPAILTISSIEEGRYIEVNNAFQEFTGYAREEVIGKISTETGLWGDARQRKELLQKFKKQGYVRNEEILVVTKTGAKSVGIVSTEMIEVEGVLCLLTQIVDITERKRLEAEKVEIEAQQHKIHKAESLNRMAGAIAHHFNNQLTVVLGHLEMAMEDLSPRSSKSAASLGAAARAARKAAEVSGLMLTYLGQTPARREMVDLSGLCQRNLPMLRAAIPSGENLETDFPSPGPTILANVNQILLALTNLVTNAVEAQCDRRGTIRLTVRSVAVTDIPTAHRFPIDWRPQGDTFACLEVADTGCGVAERDIEKLFDPFFTSKFIGRGLGLPVVLGVLRGHGGAITVESEAGRGSVFRVFFPVSAEEVLRPPLEVVDAVAFEGGGTVLLVEDEPAVREMAVTMLARMGFTVLEAKDGVEAVEVVGQDRGEIRLVVCDLTMPRMDGWETLAALRKLVPGLPVILTSGYDEARVMAGVHPELPQAFLGKPFRSQDLWQAIRQAIGDKRDGR